MDDLTKEDLQFLAAISNGTTIWVTNDTGYIDAWTLHGGKDHSVKLIKHGLVDHDGKDLLVDDDDRQEARIYTARLTDKGRSVLAESNPFAVNSERAALAYILSNIDEWVGTFGELENSAEIVAALVKKLCYIGQTTAPANL